MAFLLMSLLASAIVQTAELDSIWRNVTPGQSVASVVEILRAGGLRIAYSDAVLNDHVVVSALPLSADPIDGLKEVLEPHGLSVIDLNGLHVIGFSKADADAEIDTAATRPDPTAVENALSEIVVSASHYYLDRDLTALPNPINQRDILQFPDLGDDPLRSAMRLPGAASGGASARTHLRGAALYETGVILDGHRLLDPFHVRDYQNLFSAIDVRAIDGVEVYTGGFPIQYGDVAGGLILVDSLEPEQPRHTELGLSVFSASVLSYGDVADAAADWIFSVRRGNLDLVLNDELGEPSYFDVFAKLGVNFTDNSRVTFNGLIIEDRVLVIPAADPDEREESKNETRNAQAWLTWEQHWTDGLRSNSILAVSDVQSDRIASVDDPEKIVGNINDLRDIRILRLAQDWSLRLSKTHDIRFGGEFRHIDASYDYRSNYAYFGLFADALQLPSTGSSTIGKRVGGDTLAAYISDRWHLRGNLVLDLGVRWDRQTFGDLDDESQVSPRASLLYAIDPRSRLRFSWGRYFQSQGAHELQVEDGVVEFFPAQRSDHLILSWERDIGKAASLRLEAYRKDERFGRSRFENALDPFSIVSEIEPDRVRIDPDRGTSQGIEISVEYAPAKSTNLWASYVLSESIDDIAGSEVPRSWDQRHAAQLGLAFQGERWGYSAAVKAHSGWPKTDVSLLDGSAGMGPQIAIGPRNAGRYSPYVTVDMRLDYRRAFRHGVFSWFIEIANATNRNNACCVDFDLDPDGEGGVILDKKEDFWFPLLPAVGVLWQF